MNRDSKNRNLDGIYFRVERDGWRDICFSDLTEAEMNAVLERYDADALRRMCVMLGKRIREIGDELDIEGGDGEC